MVASVGRLTRLERRSRIKCLTGHLAQAAQRTELHRRIGRPRAASPRPLSAANCTVESDAPRAPSPSARNCTVESAAPRARSAGRSARGTAPSNRRPRAASASPPTAPNGTVESGTPRAPSAQLGRRVGLLIAGR